MHLLLLIEQTIQHFLFRNLKCITMPSTHFLQCLVWITHQDVSATKLKFDLKMTEVIAT